MRTLTPAPQLLPGRPVGPDAPFKGVPGRSPHRVHRWALAETHDVSAFLSFGGGRERDLDHRTACPSRAGPRRGGRHHCKNHSGATAERARAGAMGRRNRQWSATAYRQYLETFPEGPNAQAARDQLVRLEAAAAAEISAAQAEARLGLARTDRLGVQQRLAASGLLHGRHRRCFWCRDAARDNNVAEGQQLRPDWISRRKAASRASRPSRGAAQSPAPAANVSATSAAQAELNLGPDARPAGADTARSYRAGL